jgi:hypothetical protein
MANTFTLIASSTVGAGGASSIDFTSIPSTYTDLCLEVSLRGDQASNTNAYLISFNGSTTTFTTRRLYGNGASAASDSSSAGDYGVANGASTTASTFNNAAIYIPNYAGSTNKSFSVDEVVENNATTGFDVLTAGLWSTTSAINRVTLTGNGSTKFVQYSTAYLFGIKSS